MEMLIVLLRTDPLPQTRSGLKAQIQIWKAKRYSPAHQRQVTAAAANCQSLKVSPSPQLAGEVG
jgi:hypothetical protein